MKFLQFIESVKASEAHGRFLREDGFAGTGSLRNQPQYPAMLREALTVLKRARGSRYGMMRFEEAMTTADFPLIMGDVLDRQLLGTYQETPATWSMYARRGRVPDFRTVKRFAVDGGEGVLPAVGPLAPYQPQVLKETRYTYSVSKYGRTLNWSWESFVNDDLDALGSSSPARLARAARRSEEKYVTDLFCGTSGPDSTFYSAGNANIVTSNPVLSITALQTAYKVLGAQVDADGEPILVDMAVLVVPPALEVVAQNILNATMIRSTATLGGASNNELEVVNWMRSKVMLAVNPYIPIIASSSNGNTSWFMFASPSTGRPALELGFLQGHESPELFQKTGNQQRVGGATSPMDGSFEDDSIGFKVRHCFGGCTLDPKASVASNGSGS